MNLDEVITYTSSRRRLPLNGATMLQREADAMAPTREQDVSKGSSTVAKADVSPYVCENLSIFKGGLHIDTFCCTLSRRNLTSRCTSRPNEAVEAAR